MADRNPLPTGSASSYAYGDRGRKPFVGSSPAPEEATALTPGQLINGSARETQAALSRAEWEDYKQRFFPLEGRLIERYDNQSNRAQEQSQNAQAVNQAFNTDQGIQSRRLSRYGTNLAPDQKAALNRQNQVARTATLTDVRNLTRDAQTDLDNQILSGSSSSVSSLLRETEAA